MTKILIDKELRNLCPNVTIGCLEGKIKVNNSGGELWRQVSQMCQQLSSSLEITDIAKIKNIRDGREAYRRLGNDPTRYRLSSEALIRRALKEKGLYQVNNIVDINNLISLKSYYPVCAYDLGKVIPPIKFTVGKEGECYDGIGRGSINISRLPVFEDGVGKFGSTTSDSERAMVTPGTTDLLMCIISFNGNEGMDEYLSLGKQLLEKYGEGKNIQISMV